ncbi:hypothetical protein BGW39_001344 [Mortierella sp. 14UC]|nr:hypothetical protein BGW39_001344 [Mortierella sp. 14UC]
MVAAVVVALPTKPTELRAVSILQNDLQVRAGPAPPVPQPPASEKICKSTVLTWIARLADPGVYENHFHFEVQDTFNYNFDWQRDSKGTQYKRSPKIDNGMYVVIGHHNMTTTGDHVYIEWLGQVYIRNKADWKGFIPGSGAPVFPLPRRPHEVALQASATGCKASILTWTARKAKKGTYDSMFALVIKDKKFSQTLPWQNSKGLEVRRSNNQKWTVSHYDFNSSNKQLLLHWKGRTFTHKMYGWKGKRNGYEVQEYWNCLPV